MSGESFSAVMQTPCASAGDSKVVATLLPPARTRPCALSGAKLDASADTIIGIPSPDDDEETCAGSSNAGSDASDTESSPARTPKPHLDGFEAALPAQTDAIGMSAPHASIQGDSMTLLGRVNTSDSLSVDEDDATRAGSLMVDSDISDTDTTQVQTVELSVEHEPQSPSPGAQMTLMAPVIYVPMLMVWDPSHSAHGVGNTESVSTSNSPGYGEYNDENQVQPSSAASDLSFPSDDWSLASETSTPITPMEMLPKFKRLSHDDQLPPGVTTLMVQDIPRGYTKDQLLSRWAGDGINFFHFPLNSRHKHNARYAFVNFRSNACAADFLRRRQAEVLPSEGEQRGLSIVVATNQGLQHQLTNLRHKRFDGRHRSNVTTWYDNSHVDRWTNSASPWPYVVTGWGYPHGQYATFR